MSHAYLGNGLPEVGGLGHTGPCNQDGSPNFTYLAKEYGIPCLLCLEGCVMLASLLGCARVSVADCTRCEFSTHPKTEMLLKEYLLYWQSHALACDQNADMTPLAEQQKLYLKDWHFVK